MISLRAVDRYSVDAAALTGSVRNSTFARYRSAEAATEERIRKQREARLRQPQQTVPHSTEIPFVRSVRFPQRWIEE